MKVKFIGSCLLKKRILFTLVVAVMAISPTAGKATARTLRMMKSSLRTPFIAHY
jgi:hypothetical protein